MRKIIKTKKTKLKIANSTLRISEKLFLAPYLAVIGYLLNLNEDSFLIAISLSFVILGMAIYLKKEAIKLYDEVYEEVK